MNMADSLIRCCEDRYFPLNSRIRTEQTKRQYRFALKDLDRALGRESKICDLSDDNVTLMMSALTARGLAPKTINERRGRINALWSWLAKRGIVATWPTVRPIPEPRRIPVAWSRDELMQLLNACRAVPGTIDMIRACDWWTSLHLVAWSTGERISALLACEWSHLSADWLTIPAELRKGKSADAQYRISADAMTSLQRIREPSRALVWPWPYGHEYLWVRYKTIRKKAGLAIDRRSAFHRIRRSVATHFEAAGGDATALLGHTSRAITIKSYLDPKYSQQHQASDLLFSIDSPRTS